MIIGGQAALCQNLFVEQEFNKFYSSPKLSSNKCGLNIQHFLAHLSEQGVQSKNGYVVSVHENYGHLNHFNARWGREESYSDGTKYNRSNWYFHVFLVIEGMAYDFSRLGKNAIPLKQYLASSYLPKLETENVIKQGRLTDEILLKKYFNMEMNIYRLDDYAKSLGPVYYTGSFSELFNLSNVSTPANPLESNTQRIPEFKNRVYGNLLVGESRDHIKFEEKITQNNYSTYKHPYAYLNGENYPIMSESLEVCQSLGHMGSFPWKTLEKELEKKQAPLVDLGTSIMPLLPNIVDPKEDVRVSFRYLLNDQHWNYKIIEKVSCGDLKTALKQI
jgi:hypothetical protein